MKLLCNCVGGFWKRVRMYVWTCVTHRIGENLIQAPRLYIWQFTVYVHMQQYYAVGLRSCTLMSPHYILTIPVRVGYDHRCELVHDTVMHLSMCCPLLTEGGDLISFLPNNICPRLGRFDQYLHVIG